MVPETWSHRYATVNGVTLHYVIAGEGQTILFLHGFPEFWYAWKEQLRAFGQRYQAIALDLRGYNLSDKPERVEDYSPPLLIADVKGFLDAVSPGRKAILVGHDWGGVVAWAFAGAHPEYLEKLVIINAPHPALFARELSSNPAQQEASAYMHLLRSEQAESVLSADDYALLLEAMVRGMSRPEAFTEEDRRAYREAWSRPGALTGGLNYYRASRVGPPPPGALPPSGLETLPASKVSVPTLVIWGEQDPYLLTGNLEGLDQYVPDLAIVRLPHAGHWVIREEPELINRIIARFLGAEEAPDPERS